MVPPGSGEGAAMLGGDLQPQLDKPGAALPKYDV